MRAAIFTLALILTCASSIGSLVAQEQTPPADVDLSNVPLETKREWVRTHMVREFANGLDEETLRKIDDTVANMTPERIDRLVKNYARRDQAESQAQAQDERLTQQDAAQRSALIANYQQRLAAARAGGNPGFAPLITTLPSGASLGASAVVSPDRRYVRMNLSPFFSSVGPVQTFTFANPQPYRPYYPQPNQQRRVRAPWRP
jgi:hypothetical protein